MSYVKPNYRIISGHARINKTSNQQRKEVEISIENDHVMMLDSL